MATRFIQRHWITFSIVFTRITMIGKVSSMNQIDMNMDCLRFFMSFARSLFLCLCS